MALDNLLSISFTPQEIATINESMASIREVLAGKSVNLTPSERQQFGAIADRNKILVDKARDYMQQYPETVPNQLDFAEFEKDYQARKQLELPYRSLMELAEQFSDTKILLDSDNYQATISYYRYVKYLSQENAPGSSTIYADLRKHFDNRPTVGNSGAAPETGEL